MAATSDPDDDRADDQLTAELCRQLALGYDVVALKTIVAETDMTERKVEKLMGRYEQQHGSVERVEQNGIAWRLRDDA
jgi:hypothetical protein